MKPGHDLRFCRLPSCPNELTRDDPGEGVFVDVCGQCRAGETIQGVVLRERLGLPPHATPHPETSVPPIEPRTFNTPLSRRELDVLALIGNGHTNEEIARELGITVDTVKAHVKHVLAKTGCRSRAHAVGHGFRHRLIS